MNARTRWALLLGLEVGVAAVLVGCEKKDEREPAPGAFDAGTPDAAIASQDALPLVYSPMYSAVIEGHTAQLPVRLHGSVRDRERARYSSADPSIAEVIQTAEGAMITAKKEGKVSINVTLDDKAGSAVLTIKRYSEAQWLLGEARYNTRERAIIAPDGGSLSVLGLATDPGSRNASGACNTCHTAEAQILWHEDTPTQTAGYSDDELVAIFTQGEKPAWADRWSVPSFLWGPAHSWTVSEEEKLGLIAYLRTKPPKSQPPTGGLRPCDDAGSNPAPPLVLCDAHGTRVVVPGTWDAGLSQTMDAGMNDGGL